MAKSLPSNQKVPSSYPSLGLIVSVSYNAKVVSIYYPYEAGKMRTSFAVS